jgi:hypothetical protein
LSRTFYRRQATRRIVAESAALRKKTVREFVARKTVSRDTLVARDRAGLQTVVLDGNRSKMGAPTR